MGAYIITNSELVAIANAIRNKKSSSEVFTLQQMPNAIATIGESVGNGAVIRTATNDKYIINENKIKAIADAVRLKNGSSTKYLLNQLPQAILNIVTSYTINYYNGDTLLYSETVNSGSNSSYSGSTPTKVSDVQYTYTFSGWSKDTNDNTVDNDALTNITADRNVYACFTSSPRTYTVTFVRAPEDGGGTLQTLNNVAYGTVLTNSSYTGSTPTTTQGSGSDYAFLGWTPDFTTITGDITYTAKFNNPVEVKEITDSWDTIIANIDNGTYATKYKIGNYKPLDLGIQGTINMQIVAMDADSLTDESIGETKVPIPLTFIGIELLSSPHRWNPSYQEGVEGTGAIGGFSKSEIYTYLHETIYPMIPLNVRSRIQRTWKRAYDFQIDGSRLVTTSWCKLWLPTGSELSVASSYQGQPSYKAVFNDYGSAAMIKKAYGQTEACNWWRRDSMKGSPQSILNIGTTGANQYAGAGQLLYVPLCFCLGLEPETITDDWSTILANQNYATDYSIGDTKYLDLGIEGKHLMEIVAFDTDDRADGNGKAGITWISKYSLKTHKQMNETDKLNSRNMLSSYGCGWPACDMREYLTTTIAGLLPSTLSNSIIPVKKYTAVKNTEGDNLNYETAEGLWIPSYHEVVNANTWFETLGPTYYTKFTGISSLIKGDTWWLRTYGSSSNQESTTRYITSTGGNSSINPKQAKGVVLGFCTN